MLALTCLIGTNHKPFLQINMANSTNTSIAFQSHQCTSSCFCQGLYAGKCQFHFISAPLILPQSSMITNGRPIGDLALYLKCIYVIYTSKQSLLFTVCCLSACGCRSFTLLSRAECIVLLLGSVNRERFVFNKAPKQTVEQLTLLLHGACQTMLQNKDMWPR